MPLEHGRDSDLDQAATLMSILTEAAGRRLSLTEGVPPGAKAPGPARRIGATRRLGPSQATPA